MILVLFSYQGVVMNCLFIDEAQLACWEGERWKKKKWPSIGGSSEISEHLTSYCIHNPIIEWV